MIRKFSILNTTTRVHNEQPAKKMNENENPKNLSMEDYQHLRKGTPDPCPLFQQHPISRVVQHYS